MIALSGATPLPVSNRIKSLPLNVGDYIMSNENKYTIVENDRGIFEIRIYLEGGYILVGGESTIEDAEAYVQSKNN